MNQNILTHTHTHQDAPFKVDHIRMRSGCKCIVSPQFGNYDLAHRKQSVRFPMQQGAAGGARGGGGRGGIIRKPGVIRRTTSLEDLVRGQLDIISHSPSPVSTSYPQHPVVVSEVEGDDATSYNVGESAIVA